MNSEKYKTGWSRFFALLIDCLILSSLVYLESFFTTPETPTAIAVTGLVIYYFCTHFYTVYLHAVYGQTLGKMAMKVVVLDVSENPASIRQAILREIPMLGFTVIFLGSEIHQILTAGINESFRDSFFYNATLVGILIWTAAEVTAMLCNEKRRTIHDYIAGTVVVKTSPI